MGYLVERTVNNGNRCLCCHHSWEQQDEVETYEEALKEVPLFPSKNTVGDIESVKVTDQETGDLIGWASLSFTYERISEHYEHWVGYREDVGKFDKVFEAHSKKPLEGISWAEILQQCKEKELDLKRRQAQSEVKKLAAKVRGLGLGDLNITPVESEDASLDPPPSPGHS